MIFEESVDVVEQAQHFKDHDKVLFCLPKGIGGSFGGMQDGDWRGRTHFCSADTEKK
jgi:hypothetical protein